MATNVTLRQKPISKGRKSLYLDFYPPITNLETGKKTRREFLRIYIHDKPRTASEREKNRQNLLIAEKIRLKRLNELNKPEIYTAFEIEQLKQREKGELSFIDYYKTQMNKKNGSTYNVWVSSFNYLNEFTKGALTFSQVTERLCNDYREFLLTTPSRRSSKSKLSQNTAHSYFNKFKSTLKQAHRDGILSYDLNSRIEPIGQVNTNRIFLTKEELNKLAKTECVNPILKNASLFSALTGLRFSDVKKLKWNEIVYSNEQGYSIYFQQKKTKKHEYLPISEQAYQLLGEPKEGKNKVFEGLVYSAHLNNQLIKWAMSAGVQKPITFHVFRHTYATLQLEAGTDLYTVSKMLGHKDIRTTQIYAQIVDQTKRNTTNKIQIDFE